MEQPVTMLWLAAGRVQQQAMLFQLRLAQLLRFRQPQEQITKQLLLVMPSRLLLIQ